MNKKQAEELTNDMLVADALLKLKTMENLLIEKGVFSKEEFQAELDSVARTLAKSLLQKANVQGNLDDLLNTLQNTSSKNIKN